MASVDKGKHSTVEMETLYKPVVLGGKMLLDLKTRNEAIELMKTKRYLDLSTTRPARANITDSLIGMNISKRWT